MPIQRVGAMARHVDRTSDHFDVAVSVKGYGDTIWRGREAAVDLSALVGHFAHDEPNWMRVLAMLRRSPAWLHEGEGHRNGG